MTVQRRVILSALVDRDDHPTIDQIFADVKQRIPGVSRTTVYRALETLVELGIAKRTKHFEVPLDLTATPSVTTIWSAFAVIRLLISTILRLVDCHCPTCVAPASRLLTSPYTLKACVRTASISRTKLSNQNNRVEAINAKNRDGILH